jgi:cellulose synthase/poly-beta-1,6-N-acetylglucosamine synthase-like glycosyltransferase
MIIIDAIQYILAIAAGLLFFYQFALSVMALFGGVYNKKIKLVNYRKFAIVVPAHNEEQVISKTLYSLFSLVYPKNFYDVIVVADNCTDGTAMIAREFDAIVWERENPDLRGKGYALRWAFDQIDKSGANYDAVVVFDADTLVSGNYLQVMNQYLSEGHQVIQSSDLVLPNPGQWSSETTRIGFLLYNYVKPLGRKMLGFDMGLRGNGMCFSIDVLRENPWEAWSLTEDVEYGLRLLLNDVKIEFAPEATVWAQMPVQSKNAESQRTRWELGRYPIIKKYAPKLLKAAYKKKSIKYMDSLIELVTPPLVNSMFFVLIMVALNGLFWLFNWFDASFFWIWSMIALLGILHLFIGLIAAKADRQVYKSLLYIPIYMLWKIKVYVKTLWSGREYRWIRTTRDS